MTQSGRANSTQGTLGSFGDKTREAGADGMTVGVQRESDKKSGGSNFERCCHGQATREVSRKRSRDTLNSALLHKTYSERGDPGAELLRMSRN